jgi:hypothetical protein
MVGRSGDVNQGTTAGGGKRAGRGQSVRSSWEAGNDRGAKGRRNVVVAASVDPSDQGRRSAARLCASVRRRVAWGRTAGGQWAAWEQVSGAARLARLVRCFRPPCDECLSQSIETTNWKAGCGRPACPVWREGWRAKRHPYPYVRLRRREDRAVEVRSCAVKKKHRAVSNRNCVAARRGGEQRNENDQSVTQTAHAGRRRELDSVGVDGRAYERKAKPVGAGVNPLAVPLNAGSSRRWLETEGSEVLPR